MIKFNGKLWKMGIQWILKMSGVKNVQFNIIYKQMRVFLLRVKKKLIFKISNNFLLWFGLKVKFYLKKDMVIAYNYQIKIKQLYNLN